MAGRPLPPGQGTSEARCLHLAGPAGRAPDRVYRGTEIVEAEDPVHPGRTTPKRSGKSLHRHPGLDEIMASLCEGPSFRASHVTSGGPAPGRVGARPIQPSDPLELCRTGISPSGQRRVSGSSRHSRSLEGRADSLARATQSIGDLGQGLPLVAPPGDVLGISHGTLSPAVVRDVMASGGQPPDMRTAEAIPVTDLLPCLSCFIASESVGSNSVSLLGVQSPPHRPLLIPPLDARAGCCRPRGQGTASRCCTSSRGAPPRPSRLCE